MAPGNITEIDEFSFLDEEIIKPEDKRIPCPPDGDPRLKMLSYSSSLLLHSCPRKYQLRKLGVNAKPVDSMTQLTFDFGHALGSAVVRLLAGESLDSVIFKMATEWKGHFFQENPKQKKSLFHAIYALELFQAAREDGLLADYEIARFPSGAPAAEVSIKIYLPHGYIERGYIDVILRNKYTGEFCVFDNKSSSARWLSSAQYANSMQALGYSCALKAVDPDNIPVNYTVFYLTWMTFLERWEQFEYPKSMVQQAQWLQAKLWDIDQIERMRELYGDYGIWPLHGEACTSFGRECEFIHECHMETEKLMKPLTQGDMDLYNSPLDNQGKPWDIVLNWEDLAWRMDDGNS